MIDGQSLSKDEIALGYYTFKNIRMNHSIEVKNTRGMITLDISITQGNGKVEYSINGALAKTYEGALILNEGDNVSLKAIPDQGYRFLNWSGDISSTEFEISISNIAHSMSLEVEFDSNPSPGPTPGPGKIPLWAIVLILLLILGFAILLALYFARSYEVVRSISSGTTFIGDAKARRKKPYSFSLGGASGDVSYRTGEGEWKIIRPDADGNYVIPKEDVTGKLTIESR